MEPASLIGFAVVSIGLCWTGSLAFGVAALCARPWLRRFGPSTERVVAASALVLAPVSSFVATLLLIERSVSAGTNDHCVAHAHHPHLCLYHGGTWGETAWAVAAVVAAATALSIGLSRRLWGIWRARGARRTLQHVAGARRFRTSTVLIAPRPRSFASSPACGVRGSSFPRRRGTSLTTWNGAR
jgi:hypothetical protein